MGEVITDVNEEWKDLQKEFKELETTNKIYQQKLIELGSLQKKCAAGINHQNYRMKLIQKSIEKECGRDDGKYEEVLSGMMKQRANLNDIEQTLPKENGLYLKIILGTVNVSILNKEEKFKYKDDYEKFKLILSIIGFFFSTV